VTKPSPSSTTKTTTIKTWSEIFFVKDFVFFKNVLLIFYRLNILNIFRLINSKFITLIFILIKFNCRYSFWIEFIHYFALLIRYPLQRQLRIFCTCLFLLPNFYKHLPAWWHICGHFTQLRHIVIVVDDFLFESLVRLLQLSNGLVELLLLFLGHFCHVLHHAANRVQGLFCLLSVQLHQRLDLSHALVEWSLGQFLG
jgi:hypothetical protein